jgi:hypothetical protein
MHYSIYLLAAYRSQYIHWLQQRARHIRLLQRSSPYNNLLDAVRNVICYNAVRNTPSAAVHYARYSSYADDVQ